MLGDIFKSAFEDIKNTRFYKKIAPFLFVVCLFLAVHVLTYKYIEWWHKISLDVHLYLCGYLFKLLTLCFLLVLGLLLIIIKPIDRTRHSKISRLRQFLDNHKKVIYQRSAYAFLILLLFIITTLYVLPQRADNITIAFLTEPEEAGFDKYAFVYIVYVLNNRQQYWHFDINYEEFNENKLNSEQRKELSSELGMKSMSQAHLMAKNKPLIGITSDSLGQAFFFKNDMKVSVISTYEWNDVFSPPTIYEYLAYSLIQQSILIHLNSSTTGLPIESFKDRFFSRGDLFESYPERNAIKATMLAARLSPEGEKLLLNSFGLSYMQTCTELLTLRWLKFGEVSENLKRCFNVDLGTTK